MMNRTPPHRKWSLYRAAALVAALSMIVVACGNGETADDPPDQPDADESADESDTDDADESADESDADDFAPRALEVGHVYEEEYPLHRCGVAEMAQQFEASDAGLSFEIFPASQLGSEAEQFEQVATGQLDAALIGPTFMADFNESLRILDAAYVFGSVEDLFATVDDPAIQAEFDVVRQEQNVRVLDVWLFGERHMIGDRPVRTPDDLQGVNLRVPDSQIYVDSATAIGAIATPIAFGEAYLALQQGVANMVEGPAASAATMGFDEVSEYFSLTSHIMSTTALVINEDVWNELAPEQQEVLEALAKEARDSVTQCLAEMDEEVIDRWIEEGTVEIIDDVDIDAFQDRAAEYFGEGFPWSDLYLELTGR